METQIKTADRFRSAILSGAYWTAEELLARYQREVEQEWQACSTEERRQAIQREVTALLGWAREVTLARRQQMQSKASRISFQRSYANAVRTSRSLYVVG